MIEIRQISASETHFLRHKVMWPDKPFEFVILEEDAAGFHFGLFEDSKLISIISVFIDGENAQFRKFATDIDFQGKGLGSMLINYLIREMKFKKIKKLWCDARTTAISFYKKFGMEVESDIFIKNGKEYVKMSITLQKPFIHPYATHSN